MGEPEKKYNPTGSAREPYDKNSYGTFQSVLYNLPFQRDQATKRNKIYLALIGLLILAMVFIAVTANFKTYVVRVDSTTGRIDAGQEIKAVAYSPRDAEIKYFLMEFLRKTRGIPLDPVMYRNNWATAQHYMTGEAARKMAILVERENQPSKLNHVTTELTFVTMQPQVGVKDAYQIRWQETEYPVSAGNGGPGPKTETYVGIFSYGVFPPKEEKELAINPLGLMITDLTYAREAEFGRSE